MNKQAKININNKDYYCDSEILKLIMRNQDKIEALEYNRDKAIEYIEKHKQIAMFADLRKEGTHQYTIECDADDLLSILRGEDNDK